MYIFPFLVEGGVEGICTCTEEHKIRYEYHVEQKQISLFAQGKVVICMLNENNPVSIITFLIYYILWCDYYLLCVSFFILLNIFV
jgi:hypothetical protein